jgi:DNA-binding helix-hairpin-helix protein with protein kinase domain
MGKPTTIMTLNGNRYRLGPELGRGGQGSVFALEGVRLVVKLLRDRSPRARERMRDQLAHVARLPLEDLAVARPTEQLRAPEVGYVMELLTGMVALQELMRPAKGATSVPRWYIESGGLRRRLRLLARTAEVFAGLHGRGLIYVDPSPHNVFVSDPVEALEVRLIDTDNLCSSGVVSRALHTPGYGAPELVRATRPPSTLSDAHAFAVMAFETLTLIHPLIGDLVRDGEPELEERALAGELAWVDHPDDDSNRSSDGLPREVVLSPTLRADFAAVFGPGLSTPEARPGLARWAEHLHRAADRCLRCPSCGASYYYDRERCPWCDALRPSFMMAGVLLWDPQGYQRDQAQVERKPGIVRDARGKLRVTDAVAFAPGDSVRFDERLLRCATTNAKAELRVELDTRGRDLELEAHGNVGWRLVSTDGRRTLNVGDKPVVIPVGDRRSWELHTGPEDALHRVIRFDLKQGGRR